MVQMQSYGNSDALYFHYIVDHVCYVLVAAHVLAGTLRYLNDDGRVLLLSAFQNSLCPLKVVQVDCRNCVVACYSLLEHFFCRY